MGAVPAVHRGEISCAIERCSRSAAMNQHISVTIEGGRMTPQSFTDARKFIAKVLHWPEEGEPGYVNIVSTYQKEGYDKPLWGGRAVKDIDGAINAISWLAKQPETKNIYFCTSLQSQAKERAGKNGCKYHTPVRNQENALLL